MGMDEALTCAGSRGVDDRDKLLGRDPDMGLSLLYLGDRGADVEIEAAAESDELGEILGFKGGKIVGRRGATQPSLLIDVEIWNFDLGRGHMGIEDGAARQAAKHRSALPLNAAPLPAPV